MKSILRLLSLLMISSIVISYGCSNKGGGSTPPPPPDPCIGQAAVSATTVPAVNTLQTAAVGPDFPLAITLTNVPTAGVSIVVNARPETPAGSAAFFSQTHTVTSTTDNFTITGTPSGVICVVDITITSKSCGTNTWTGTYRYSKK